MIVSREQERGAVFPGAGHVGVAENVARPVDAGTFSVPDAEDSVDLRFSGDFEDLAAHHGGRGQIFIQAGLEYDVMLVEHLTRAGELQIVAAQRTAFVARDKRAGVEAGTAIAAHLVHRQANQGLNSGEVDAATLDRVLVGEAHGRRNYVVS